MALCEQLQDECESVDGIGRSQREHAEGGDAARREGGQCKAESAAACWIIPEKATPIGMAWHNGTV